MSSYSVSLNYCQFIFKEKFVSQNMFSMLNRFTFFIYFAVSMSGFAFAQTTPEVAKGLQWLSSQVQLDPNFTNLAAPNATSIQARTEALYSLSLLNAPTTVIAPLQKSLQTDGGNTTEYLSRRAWALGFSGIEQAAIVKVLEERQYKYSSGVGVGGYGNLGDFTPHALDTAYVLLAQKNTKTANAATIVDALTHLSTVIGTDGSFSVNGQTSFHTTATALLAAAAWANQTSTSAMTVPTTKWLLSQRNSSLHYGNSFHNALALWALVGQTADAAILSPLVNELIAKQLPNGSWNDDPYLTSIALRALFLVTKIPPSPTTGAINGFVVDASNASKISGAVVQIVGTQRANAPTDANGSFGFTSVLPGTLTLRFTKIGYASKDVTVSIDAGQNLNIGTVALSPASLTAALSGIVGDQNGNPLADAIVTVGSASVLTGANGTYQITDLPPGPATITASKVNYQTATASAVFVAGSSFSFSPRLYASGVVQPTVSSLTGVVVDSITKAVLPNVSVKLGSITQVSSATGTFTFDAVVPGAFTLTLSANGYQSLSASGITVVGINDVGNIGLTKLPTTSSLSGIVTDAATSLPIAGATINVSGQAPTGLTGADGKYTITGLNGTSFILNAVATGYLPRAQTVSLNQVGNATVDIQLIKADVVGTDISFVKIAMSKPAYPASGEIALYLTLGNKATSAANVTVSAQVLNTQNSVVHEYFASPVIGWMGKTYANNPVNISAGGTLELDLDWNTLRLPAGVYSVNARAVDSDGRIVAQSATAFSVAETSSFVGGVTADPPLAQAGAKTPISLTADLVNNGNLTIPSGELQLRVTLDTPDATENQQTQVSLRSFATGAPMKSSKKLVVDANGNLYTVNSSDGKLIKIDSNGVQSIIATLPTGSFSDLAIDTQNIIWIGTAQNGKLYKVDASGLVTALTISVLSQIDAIDVNQNGGIILSGRYSGTENGKYVSNESRLVQRDAEGVETVLWKNGLVSPEAIVKDSSGNYVVTNSGDGTLVKVSPTDGLISPFATGLNQPKGITADAAGNFYVANAGNNTIVKVSATGQTSVYATGFNQPYDLKFDPTGNLYVSNAGDDSILKVLPNGTVQLFSKGIANSPQGMKYDSAGNLWIANNDGTLRKKDPQDNVSVVATGLSSPRGIAIASNGDVLVAENSSGKVSKISNGVKTTFATGLSSPWGVAIDGAGDVHVSEYGADRIVRFDSLGKKLGVTETLLNRPSVLRTTSSGDVYIQNSGFLSVQTGGTVKVAQRNFNYSYWAPDAVNGGIVALSGNSVLRIDAAGIVTTLKSGLTFYPDSVAIDNVGNIILNDYSNRKLQKLDSTGAVSQLATFTDYVYSGDLQADTAGNLIVRMNTGVFNQVSPSGVVTAISHTLPYVYGWSAADAGFLNAWSYDKTYRVNILTGATTVLLTTRGYYNNGKYVSGAAVDGSGNLLLSDSNSQTLSVYSPTGTELNQLDGFVNPRDIVWTGSEIRFADSGNRFYGSAGNAYPIKKSGTFPVQYLTQNGTHTLGTSTTPDGGVYKWTGMVGGYETYANISGYFTGLAAKADGSLAVASNSDSRIVVLDNTKAIVKDFAGLRTPQGLAFDAAGRLYVANYSGSTIARFDSLASPAASTVARMYYPQNLALDTTGQLLVSHSNNVSRINQDGVVSTLTSGNYLKGLLVDGANTLAVDQSNGQIRKYTVNAIGNTWETFASGLANPVALRAASNGDVFVLNQSNNTVVKYAAGKLDTVASIPAGMNAMNLASDGTLTVAGNYGVAKNIAADGTSTDLSIAALLNQWSLTGVARNSTGKLFLTANDPSTSVGTVFEVTVQAPTIPPAAGTVVYQTTAPMPALPLDGNYVHYDFGTWTPSYGGDFKVEVSRTGVDGKSTNFIHVGSNAQSLLTASKSVVPPGDSDLQMCLDIKGADFTSISKVELSQVRPVSSSGRPNGMAGDRQGNLYVTDSTTLYKTNAAGQSTVIADGMQLSFGLATDSLGNFYVASRNPTSGRYELIRISLQGVKTVVADLGVTTANGVQVNSKDEILVGSPSKLLKVSQKGVLSVVTNAGLPQPRGIAVDGRDNVYVQNESDFVSMVKPDGASVSIFSKGDGTIDPIFEGDGYPNIAADCADNFYIAPFQWAKINQSGEEHSIAQVVPRTGKIALLFDAQKINPTLNDIDYLSFDRLNNRLLMWNDYEARIWQVPVSCGAIGVQAHLVAKLGQTLTGASKPPSATVPLADGRTEYVWSLRDVTAQGAQICFSANQQDVKLGEERKAIDSGYISFQNSFAPGEVSVPLAIPLVRAANLINLTVATDLPAYAANATAKVTTTLNNSNTAPVSGALNVQVFDGNGVLVGNVTQQAITLAAGSTMPVDAIFDIGSIVPAPYTVKAVLVGADRDLATAKTTISVLPSNANATAKSTVATDRKVYNTNDRVVISSRAINQSSNIVLDNLTLNLQVYNAANTLLFSKIHAVVQLPAGAFRDYAVTQTLVNVPAGIYTIKQTLSDSESRVLDQQTTSYNVGSSADTGYGLVGQIVATQKEIALGSTEVLNFTITNSGNANMSNIPVVVRIVDPVLNKVMAEFPYKPSIIMGASFVSTSNWIATGTLGTQYIAVLSATFGGSSKTLAQDTFVIKSIAQPKLDIIQSQSKQARILVLASCKTQDEGHHDKDDDERSCGKPENEQDDDDDRSKTCVSDRASTIKQELTALGVSHTVVTNTTEFKRALRGGLYNTYWISGKQYKLHDDLADEIREAVFAGDRLILDGVHDERNKVLDLVAGITYRGKLEDKGLQVNTTGTLFKTQHLAIVGQALKVIANGSQVVAAFEGRHNASGPAVLTNSYGQGKAIMFAFDYVSSLRAQALWKPVLADSLQYLLPIQSNLLTPGALLPVKTAITNQGAATGIQVKMTLPASAAVLGSNPTGVLDTATNSISWAFDLPALQTKDLFLTLRVPPTAGDFELQTRVSTVTAGVANLYGAPIPLAFKVITATQNSADVKAKLTALVLKSKKDIKLRQDLLSDLQTVMTAFNKNTSQGYETAIHEIIEMIEDMASSTAVNMPAIRLALDAILKEAQWRWSLLPVTGKRDDYDHRDHSGHR
jgi:sugar lactone lactonase YvrE